MSGFWDIYCATIRVVEPRRGIFAAFYSDSKGVTNVNDDFDVCVRVQQLARENNLSLHSLAIVCGINPSTLAMKRKRGGDLSLDTIRRICNGLGITLGEFFTPPNSEMRS